MVSAKFVTASLLNIELFEIKVMTSQQLSMMIETKFYYLVQIIL